MQTSWNRVSDSDAARARELPPTPLPAGGGPGDVAVTYEHNPKLADGKWAAACRKMFACPPVAIGWGLIRDLAASIPVTVDDQAPEGADANTIADAAEAVRRLLGLEGRQGVGATWSETFEGLLMAAAYGFGVSELDGFEADGRWWLRLVRYEPESIYRWWQDRRGAVAYVEQSPLSRVAADGSVNYGSAKVPVSQLLIQRFHGSPGDVEGDGLFRPIQAEVRDRDLVSAQLAIGAQRWATSAIDVAIDPDKARSAGVQWSDVEVWTKAEQALAEAWARAYMAGSKAYVVRPIWWVISTLGGSAAHDPSGLTDQVKGIDETILRQFRAQILALGGQGAGGSYSLAESTIGIAMQMAHALVEWVLADIQDQFVARFLAWNYDLPREQYPVLRAELPAGKLAEITLDRAAQVGLWTPSDADEDAYRSANSLPDRTADRTIFDRTRTSPLASQAGQVARAGNPPSPPPGPTVTRRTA